MTCFKKHLYSYNEFKDIPFKIAIEDDGKSFYKLTIKVKDKIVADGLDDSSFDVTNTGKHLSAKEFNQAMQDPNTIVVDMRNQYESEVGHFQGAICPDADTFREELPMVKNQLKGKEDKKILLYCTGGIRCEKASAYLKHNGFKDTNQLHGGIIEYKKQVDQQGLECKFKGKNFIGYEYTILRNIFYQQKNFLFKKKENKPKKIVICMGGSDPNNITLKLLEIINKYAQDEIFFDIVVGPGYKPKEELNLYLKEFKYNFKLHQSLSEKRMVDLLNVCNLAIITFGVTAYELAALAVPSIHICLDKDHFEASNVFQENGIANSFKVYKLSKLNIVVKYFFYLLNNENLINKMNKKAKLISNKIKECRVAIVLFEIMKNV